MIPFVSAGFALGVFAGLSPGPLLALVISQTVKHGPREGAKVAFAPLMTDFPIILISTFILVRLSNYKTVLGIVSILGGIFLIYLAYQSIKTSGVEVGMDEGIPQSFMKGAIVNALNPHPYLFWITVGGPIILKGLAESYVSPALFLGSFFGCLVGSKVLLAFITGKSRHFLIGRSYFYIMRFLGFVLLVFAFLLLKDGVGLLK